jgi:hypothetical protein
MANLALGDLVSPYLLKGDNLGAYHAALSVIRVTAYSFAASDDGIAIRGRAEFNGQGRVDISQGRLLIAGSTNEATPPFDPQRRSPVFDLAETSLDFEIFVPRDGSMIIGQGEGTIAAAGFAQTRAVLDVWGTVPVQPAPSDYPSSGFTLDLIVNAPSIRPPFLQPAKMNDRGLLEPDSSVREVSLSLPRLRFRLAHGNPIGSQLRFDIVSFGTEGLDDPGDIGEAELIAMTPPYAFIGGPSDREVGIGFRKAVLDLSSNATPPEIISKFGFGDDWSGLYLPEVRIFVAPNGAQDLAIEAGVQDLLIGFGATHGISGDFELAVIDQGHGDLTLSARFFDADGHAYGIEQLSPTTARVILPGQTRMVIDIQGGLPPYTTSLNGAASSRLYNIDLAGNPQQSLVITGHDSTGGTPKTATLTIQAQLRTAQTTLPPPDGGANPTQRATPDPAVTDPQIIIAFQTDSDVTLTTDPQTVQVMWTITNPPGGAETGPQATFSVPLAAGETKTVRARLPGTTVPTELFYYFYFDEPPRVQNPQQEDSLLGAYADGDDNISTGKALTPLRNDGREPGALPALGDPRRQLFDTVVPPGTALKVYGEASFEADASDAKLDYNYKLARRRAIAVCQALAKHHAARGFSFKIDPEPSNMADYPGPNARFPSLAAWKANWAGHSEPNRRDWWSASVELPPGLSRPEKHGDRTVTRPSVPLPPPPVIPVVDPPAPNPPDPPTWFRSAKLKARIVQDVLVALEVDLEVDLQTAAEQQLNSTGQIPGGVAPTQGQTLQNGTPLGPDNPADGITKFELLVQSDQATGKITSMIQIGADPADKDGLFAFGWLPGQPRPPDKDFRLALAGSYISFWPMLVDFSTGNRGDVVDRALTVAALEIAGTVAALSWFRVERVILFGGEYLERDNPSGEIEAYLLFDVEADWSADISKLITIDPQFPLAVRYKAIGIRLGNRDDAQTPKFTLKPVFDASRGFTIDVARGGSIKLAPPFDKILKILAARLSRTNPLTFEVDIGCGIDLGVVTIDRVRLRVFLEKPVRPPELTAFGASIDIPGAIAGRGYLEIGEGAQPNTSKIGGQIDVTIRPINLRVAAAFEMQDIIDPNDAAHHATAVYVGLNVVLPVGIPLGTSGLGIFGFRGIFGMQYMRNDQLGSNTVAPALGWLQATEGQPHLIQSPKQHNILWQPKLDNWAFGVGILLGTMEGGVILNLDGTLLLELPGPRLAIVMNARIISPPPSLDGMGSTGGILAIIEITPDHFLIGIILDYDIASLIKIRVPVDAFFSFTDASDWHFYLGQRAAPVAVTVLDIIKATGYLMIKGNGLDPLPKKHLPDPVVGFGIGAGAAASFTWGDTGVGLYLRIAGSFDAVMGFDPFLLEGEFELSGELRLFIVSIGASAELDILAVGHTDSPPAGSKSDLPMLTFKTRIHGQACGHVDFFFFSVEGCVDVTLGLPNVKPGIPNLVEKLSIKSRSPALLVGTGVDRPIDTSLGKGIEQDTAPSIANGDLPIVPIDSVLVVGLGMPPTATGLTFMGAPITGSTGQPPGSFVNRGSEKYAYTMTAVTLERADGGPALLGSNAPATWWTPGDASSANVNAQLALLTWEPDPATKAFEKTELRTNQIRQRWQHTCEDAAPPTRILWTFLDERLGPSPTGWDLEGIAWPDPPNTRRKEPPPTAVHVTERWRCGDAKIDGLRGIIPAIVLGALIKCRQQPPPRTVNAADVMGALGGVVFDSALARRLETLDAAQATPQLQRIAHLAQAGAPARLLEKASRIETIPTDGVDAVTVAGKLVRGMATSRFEIAATFFAPVASASPAARVDVARVCQTRVLESPILDDGRLIVFGNAQRDRQRVADALKQAGVTHWPLNNVVVLNTGAFVDAALLVFVRRQFFEGNQMVVRTLAQDGSELLRVAITAADRVATKPLPARWNDPSGPWMTDVQDAR